MTPEAQRIAIAEACGWRTTDCTVCGAPGYVAHNPSGESFWNEASCLKSAALIRVIPDYLSDLNAMHEAEKVLTDEQDLDYSEALEQVVGARFNSNNSEDMRRLRSATAAQRAEAFLRTIGKWKD